MTFDTANIKFGAITSTKIETAKKRQKNLIILM